MQYYSFISIWQFQSGIKPIWPIIKEVENWPLWWKGVRDVKILSEGNESGLGKKAVITWQSKLPYSLSFTIEVTEIEMYTRISGLASGDLIGTGIWFFEEHNQITELQFHWQVNTTKKWMNVLGPLLRPVFIWNHNLVMEWGRKGLDRYLHSGRR